MIVSTRDLKVGQVIDQDEEIFTIILIEPSVKYDGLDVSMTKNDSYGVTTQNVGKEDLDEPMWDVIG